ncbi:MAG: type II toxin-antitoxin system RelE/ParE family toxin [Bacteroidales bacterium]|nr:type II toxin-antitoxin system RelE/ParE family toxin [Bacteroidales bacterium]
MRKVHSTLEKTDYYEMRVSVGDEYRVILFTVDSRSFMESNEVLLINGFLKKSTKDYKKQIGIADRIKTKYYGN